MQEKAIPTRLNITLGFGVAALTLTQMFVMPVVLHDHPWAMIAIILSLSPFNTPFWSLIHEGVHRNLLPRASANEWASRLMSVLFGAAFDVLRFGHLMHHQYNRHWESEFYDDTKNKLIVWFGHYAKMLGGLYLIEVATSFLIAISPLPVARKIAQAALPDEKHQQAVLNALLKPRIVARLRFDCVLILTLYIAAAFTFGANWPVLALFIMARAILISLMDNAYHYGTPADNSVVAKELKTPGPLAKFILNFNHHETHHRNTGLPWTQLRAQHDAQRIPYSEGLISALTVQFKGPLKKETIH